MDSATTSSAEMHKESHLGVAFLGYIPVIYLLMANGRSTVAILGLVGIAFGSTLPDIDLEVPFLTHRGLTHSVVGAAVAGGLYAAVGIFLVARGIVSPAPWLLAYLLAGAFAFFVGAYAVVLHLVGDILTPMGIQPFQPFSDASYTLNLTRAANDRANEALFTAGTAALVGALLVGVLGLAYVLNNIADPLLGAFR